MVSFAKHVHNFRIVPSSYEELVLLEIDFKDERELPETPVPNVSLSLYYHKATLTPDTPFLCVSACVLCV